MPTITSSSQIYYDTLVKDIVAGMAGGYLCFPFEGMKKRLQSGQLNRMDFQINNLSNKKLLTTIAPRELFRGSMPFSFSVTITTTISFACYRSLQGLPQYKESYEAGVAIASGAFAAVFGSTPVENTILVQQKRTVNPVGAVAYMLKRGVFSPWIGVKELMCREAGFAGVMFYAAPRARQIILKETNQPVLAFIGQLGTGIFGSLATHPFDTVATHRQNLEGKVGTIKAVKDLYQTGGLPAFYRGGTFRVFLFTGCALIIPKIQQVLQPLGKNSASATTKISLKNSSVHMKRPTVVTWH